MTDDELLDWARDHGYRHYRCNICGWSGWTDGDPRAECYCDLDEEEELYAQCANGGQAQNGLG
jgi:hypothetical protein